MRGQVASKNSLVDSHDSSIYSIGDLAKPLDFREAGEVAERRVSLDENGGEWPPVEEHRGPGVCIIIR